MKYRVELIDNWLWGHLPSVKKRLERIKNGMRYKKDNDCNEMCPFCGGVATQGGNGTEADRNIYPCGNCKTALAYGYLTEVLAVKDNS